MQIGQVTLRYLSKPGWKRWICECVGLSSQRLYKRASCKCKLTMLGADVDIPVNVVLLGSRLVVCYQGGV